MAWVLIEDHPGEDRDPVLWGPFKSKIKAADFAHRRIAMLCNEWHEPEDGFILEHLQWKIQKLTSVD